MRGSKALFSKASDYWGTPQDFFDKLDKEIDFTLDPCADRKRSLKKGMKEIYEDSCPSGLEASWTGHRVFVNPPYSQMKFWAEKIVEEAHSMAPGGRIVVLVPARTDTIAWHRLYRATKIPPEFTKGRLQFVPLRGQDTTNTPFPSCTFYFVA